MKVSAAGSVCVAAVLALSGLGAALWRPTPPAASDADLALHHPDQYAWKLFAAVNRPASGRNEQWLAWSDASHIYPPPNAGMFRQSRATPFLDAKETVPPDTAFGDCGGAPRMRIRMNDDAAQYVTDNELNLNAGIHKYAVVQHHSIAFPSGSVEMKLGWLPSPHSAKPQFIMPNAVPAAPGGPSLPWALGGFHIMSKAVPQWFFATFESTCVQSTGPDLVDPALRDKFGYPDGIHMSAELGNLFQNNHLDPVWKFYRLVGAQTGFTASGHEKPLELGNRVIEAGRTTPSCMVCHRLARADTSGVVVDFPQNPPLARPDPSVFRNRIPLDSVWSLMQAGNGQATKMPAARPPTH